MYIHTNIESFLNEANKNEKINVEKQYSYWYKIITGGHLAKPNKYAEKVLDSIKSNKYMATQRQIDFIKSVVRGDTDRPGTKN